MKRMKSVVFYEPLKLSAESRPVPEIGADEVLVKVRICGICGSDQEYFFGGSPVQTPSGKGPLVLGHEFTGEVAEMGKNAESLGLLKPGDPVVVNPVQYCHSCAMCLSGSPNLCEKAKVLGVSADGAFAEYTKAHYTALYKLSAGVSFEQGAFVEPLSCAINAVNKLGICYGDSCAVIGSGAIGLMMLQLVKAAGAGRTFLIGTRDFRLELGKKLGADKLLNVQERGSPYYCADVAEVIRDGNGGKKLDKVIVPTGSASAMAAALAVSGNRAKIVYFGIAGTNDLLSVPVLETLVQDKQIIFSWLGQYTFATALKALASGAVRTEELVTEILPLDQLELGLKRIRAKKEQITKLLIRCTP